jgi:hypothetical protein
VIRWNRPPDPAALESRIEPTPASNDLHAFLDAKLNDVLVSLSRNRQAMVWLHDRATDDASLLAMVGAALAAIGQQERTLAEIRRRLVREQHPHNLSTRASFDLAQR